MSRLLAQARASLSFPPDHGAVRYLLYGSAAAGEAVDYTNPLTTIAAWPDEVGRGGLGDGPFGSGAFGIGPGGVGMGQGAFGMGRFGYGESVLTWSSNARRDGVYRFAAVGVDAAGNHVATPSSVEVAVTLAGVPQPPGTPRATAYVAGADALTVTWPLSPDDN